MRLPFTIDQFLDVFRQYNITIWPTQWVLVTLGILAAALAVGGRRPDNRWVSGMLAVLWLWMAVAYHLAFFASINRVAVLFAAGFLAQSALFAWLAVRKPLMTYRPSSRGGGFLGALMLLYAFVLYPAIGSMVGHRYPAAPTFGVPCPTTIFTLGLLVWAGRSLPQRLLIVPLAWSVVATSAAVGLGMVEDFGLPIAAVAAVIWLRIGHRSAPKSLPVAGPPRLA